MFTCHDAIRNPKALECDQFERVLYTCVHASVMVNVNIASKVRARACESLIFH